MVKFVGEEKMTPVQLALETARFELSFSPEHRNTTEAIRLINVALEELNGAGKCTEPSTCP